MSPKMRVHRRVRSPYLRRLEGPGGGGLICGCCNCGTVFPSCDECMGNMPDNLTMYFTGDGCFDGLRLPITRDLPGTSVYTWATPPEGIIVTCTYDDPLIGPFEYDLVVRGHLGCILDISNSNGFLANIGVLCFSNAGTTAYAACPGTGTTVGPVQIGPIFGCEITEFGQFAYYMVFIS